jgi:hypothetical protein
LFYLFCIVRLWIFQHTRIGFFFATYYLLLIKIGILLTIIFFFIRHKLVELICVFFFYFILSYTILMPYRLLYKWYSFSILRILVWTIILYFFLASILKKLFTDPKYPYNFYCWFDVLFFSIIIKPTPIKIRLRACILSIQPVLLVSFLIRIFLVKSKPYFVLIVQHLFFLIHFCLYIPYCLYAVGMVCHGY